MKRTPLIIIATALVLLAVFLVFLKTKKPSTPPTPNKPTATTKVSPETPSPQEKYPLHQDITTTVFWIGEPASADNDFISNTQSAWDSRWSEHYGGFDNPEERNGYYPAGFIPKENPFYFALPYNDFDENGERKDEALQKVYWANEKNWAPSESMLKNRWIKITLGEKTVYAQWEDVGPFQSDDTEYVFGNDYPTNTQNHNVGLDVSPAVRDYLGLDGMNQVNWQFIDAKDVPDGPWKEIITVS